MIFKLAVVLVLAFVAVANASYVVIETYSDAYCNTTAIAKYITLDESACQTKRSVAQKIPMPTGTLCDRGLTPYTYYIVNTTGCSETTAPSLPSDGQLVQVSGDSGCNSTATTTSFLAAPEPLNNTLIAIYYDGSYIAASTTFSCGSNGVQTVAVCIDNQGNVSCISLNLQAGNCTADETQTNFGLQQTCVAPPVSPIAAPVSEPLATPNAASPVKTPLKAPVTKTSTASLLVNCSIVLLSFICALI